MKAWEEARPGRTLGAATEALSLLAHKLRVFGPPNSEDLDDAGEHYMVFEVEPATGRLLTWSAF